MWLLTDLRSWDAVAQGKSISRTHVVTRNGQMNRLHVRLKEELLPKAS